MILAQALRFSQSTAHKQQSTLAMVGSGGKSTALFQLARELPPPVILTATTHLHINQVGMADSHWIGRIPEDLVGLEEHLHGVMLVTGPLDGDRTMGLNNPLLTRLHNICISHALPLLIEADGSRQRPIKAPADHEPVIPEWVDIVVVITGLTGLDKPLTEEFVHRPEIYARLGNANMGEPIQLETLIRVLAHPFGGLKNIPSKARRILLLNQADTPELRAKAKSIAEQLIPIFQAVISASLDPHSKDKNQPSGIHAVYESTAGIILAAGSSSRFGKPKALLDWHGKPFIRAVAEAAITADLSPLVVVTGSDAEMVETALKDLPLKLIHNRDWNMGQSSSIHAGLNAVAPLHPESGDIQNEKENSAAIGAAVFLLADQPQITPSVIRALKEEHYRTLAPIVAPQVQGQRANPVLFDRLTFPDLMALHGDVGGRGIFGKHPVDYLPWHDERLLSDVDTPEDYRRLVNGE